MEEQAVLLLGSNLGDREANLSRALELLKEAGEVLEHSSVMESEPWGEVSGSDGSKAGAFLNMAVVIRTELEPDELLAAVKEIERRMGREPSIEDSPYTGRKYLSRTIDIDIIYYGCRIVDTPLLKVPHPLMAERAFVLEPLSEILPAARHPVTGLTPGQMLGLIKKHSL